jgi:hypothetical protein
VVKNYMGHDLTRIRLGDKWRGWRIVDRELAEWLRRERLVLSAFVTEHTWGMKLVGYDGVFVTNFSVEWGADLVVDRKDLVELVTWICDRSAGVPVNEFAVDPGDAAEASAKDLQRVRKLLKE